ncbi:MAG: NAD(P)-binding domain-containing protein [Pseudomonadota bacterium]
MGRQPRQISTAPASVLVVGAGPSGLVATKTLVQAGLSVTCMEMSDTVGGHWNIDNANGRSAAYESLTTNTNKSMSRLSDYGIPEPWPDLPSHAQMFQWWQDYATRFDIWGCIQLQTEVLACTPQDDHWQVSALAPSGSFDAEFDALVLASGNYWSPKLPNLSGSFSGQSLHALEYRSPDRPVAMSGNRVLIVGSGNTGCEIALELSKDEAAQVFLSARSGNWILPKYVEGPDGPVHIARNAPLSHPQDDVPTAFKVLPASWREALFERVGARMFARQFGAYARRLADAGLPEPPANPFLKRAAVADGLAEALESGAIIALPGVTEVNGKRVQFANGHSEDIDTIIFATGYHLEYPFLEQSVLSTAGDDMDLFYGLMHPDRHNLFVVGVSRPSGAFWPIAEAQAQFIGQLLCGAYVLPALRTIHRNTGPTLRRNTFNPAFYGLRLREELNRGARRARRM